MGSGFGRVLATRDACASMLGNLWARLKALFARLLRHKPPEPGRFETDSSSALRGLLASAPWILPSRDYLVYVPRGHVEWRRAPLIVLIHGCRQTAEDIAAGTRIAALADELGCLVLLPRQNPRANAWGCWNWFDRATESGWGETAIVAAQIRAVRRKYMIHRRRVFVAGMSAGGALAAALGMRRPELIAGVFVHSGLACGVASSAVAALSVMKRGADTDYKAIARSVRTDTEPDALPVALVAIQGENDPTVAPVNAAQLVRQYLVLNGHPAGEVGPDDELPVPDNAQSATTSGARVVVTSEWRVADRVVASHVLVGGLGHAWSGGDDKLPYNDAGAPYATALLGAFVRRAMQ
ncbi:MAG: PHB depolymerase family esterase [Betaproteobacteria bacterium]